MNKSKKAFLYSLLALLVSISMFIGSTFAWFTDSVTTGNNTIQSGTLEVTMEWAEGDEDPASATYANAAGSSIFNNQLWEPGYTEAKHVKISNIGSLALKYALRIQANGVVSALADVIDVYYFDSAIQLTRENYMTGKKLGTLSQVLDNTNDNALSKTISGSLLAKTSKTITIALHMQEDAGNDYQGLAIGSNFSIELLATQFTYENDSFDDQYDQVTLVTNAEELKAALANGDTPVLPDGSVYEEPEDALVVWNTTDLTAALKKANNGKTVFLAAGEYTLPTITSTSVKDFTIIGTSLAYVTNDTAKTNYFSGTTFENVTFTNNIVAKFAGDSTIKNCTFLSDGVEATKQCSLTGTLTVENCTFNGVDGIKNLHFGGNDGKTLIIKDCVFNRGYVAFGKGMNITLENCDFNGGVASCYGSYTFNNCTFDADAQVYIHANTGATSVTITMNGCTVDGGADVTSVCYNVGNNNGGTKQFVIDGTTYNHDELQPY